MLAQIAPNLPPNGLQVNVPDNLAPVLMVGLGIVVLLFGRSLYWAFVAIAGFLLGMILAQHWLADKEEWIRLLAALGAGLLGAILGIFIQRLAFAIGGFFAGGYLALVLVHRFQLGGDPQIWWIAGGVIGAIVAAMIMDWAIIVLSSLAGAAAILTPFQTQLDDRLSAILYLVLVVIGIVVQSRHLALRRRLALASAPVLPPP